MMSKFPSPILRARFILVSPVYELGIADAGQYAQMMVALFSGIVWLSRDTMSASHIRFFLKSPGDSQYFAALQASTPGSLFSKFTIDGALIECSLKEDARWRKPPDSRRRLNLAITHFANALLGCVPYNKRLWGQRKC